MNSQRRVKRILGVWVKKILGVCTGHADTQSWKTQWAKPSKSAETRPEHPGVKGKTARTNSWSFSKGVEKSLFFFRGGRLQLRFGPEIVFMYTLFFRWVVFWTPLCKNCSRRTNFSRRVWLAPSRRPKRQLSTKSGPENFKKVWKNIDCRNEKTYTWT